MLEARRKEIISLKKNKQQSNIHEKYSIQSIVNRFYLFTSDCHRVGGIVCMGCHVTGQKEPLFAMKCM